MKRLAFTAAVFVSVGISITACSSASDGLSTPTPTGDVNAIACQEFEDLSMGLSDILKIDKIAQPWEGLREDYDSVGLKAEGDVKERIALLVDGWPEVSQIVIYRNFDAYNDPVNAVARACAAAGTPIEPDIFAEE